MATSAAPIQSREPRHDYLSGTPRAHAIDRWIYVYMAASFIAIVLAGFIPSSLEKIAAVQAGQRPPFPMIMHMHAVLMGSFLLLVLAQTTLVATGRIAAHMTLGLVSLVLAPALVIVGFLLAVGNYQAVWGAALSGPMEVREPMRELGVWIDNILLLQIRVGILFPLFLAIGLAARRHNPGLHKRMMILATAVPLAAGIDRIPWIPHTFPNSPLSADLYTLLAVSPMFLWDVIRNRYIHRAYWLWIGIAIPFTIALYAIWDSPWWHATARQMMM